MTCWTRHVKSWVQRDNLTDKLSLMPGASIIMIFFWLWTVLPNATISVINTHETKLKLDHVLNWDDQWRYSNSWRINHMLGDIFFGTQLLVTHLVTTLLSSIITTFLELLGAWALATKWACFLPLSVLIICRVKQNEKTCSFSFLEPLALRYVVHIFHDHRDDHRLKMSRPSDWPRVGCTQCHQACDGRTNCLRLASDHYSRARDAEIILFHSEFVMTMSVTFEKLITAKKKVVT